MIEQTQFQPTVATTPTRPRQSGSENPAATERTITDTVDLSADGQKAINLNRGLEQANDIRAEKDPATLVEKLRQAMDDIFRVTKLFNQTFKALFQRFLGS
jgi:hypothetical protein